MNWLDEALKSQYHIYKILKQSDLSEVIVLLHKRLNRKIIKRTFVGDSIAYKTLINYTHPNLVRIYQVHLQDEKCVVLEEYIEGLTLDEILMSGLYSEKAATKTLTQILNALIALHCVGIIHKDIKPENIMVSNEGKIVLIDYHTSKIHKPSKIKDTKIIGTIGYSAPEQFGFAASDERTDIYALGVLLNVMLTGEHPSKKLYEGSLKKVIEKCIKVDPDSRYQTVIELKERLCK